MMVRILHVAILTFFYLGTICQTPGGIDNVDLRLWLQGDDVFQTTGEDIDVWSGYVSDNHEFMGVGTARLPSVSREMLNFHTVLDFDGGRSEYLRSFTNAPDSRDERTFFSVFKIYSTTFNGARYSHVFHYGAPYSGSSYGMTVNTYDNNILGNHYWMYDYKSIYRTNINDVLIGSISYEEPWERMHVNGELQGEVEMPFLNTAGANHFDYKGFYIGSRISWYSGYDVDEFFDGGISEMIGFDRALTANEFTQVESYLAIKYGITLSKSYLASDESIVWDFANNDRYITNVFGIGKDNGSGLHQKISSSVNNDGVLTISTNSDFQTKNSSIGRVEVENDLSFLMLSSNGGATEANRIYELPQGYNKRIGREWKVSSTNFTQSISLKFNLNFSSSDDVHYHLMKDSDGDFSDGAILVGELLNTGVIDAVDLSDGDYLTIVTSSDEEVIPISPGGVDNNLKLWLRANSIEEEPGNNVLSWQDESSFGHVFYQPNISNRPIVSTNYLNYNKVLDFEQFQQQYLEGIANIAPGSDPRTILAVIKVEDVVNSRFNYNHVLHYGNTAPNQSYGMTLRTFNTHNFGNHYWDEAGLSDYVADYNEILLGIVAYDGTKDHFIVNGHYAGNHEIILNTGSIANLKIGSRLDGIGNEYFDGWIAEIIGYNKFLSYDEISSVVSYLAIKYGMSLNRNNQAVNYLASNGTVVWDTLSNDGYISNIFGIARDDSTDLHQKISTSINEGEILTIATDNRFDDLESDADSREDFVENLSYLMLSSNDENFAIDKTEELPMGYEKRMAREWKVSSTNFDQPISMFFDLPSDGNYYYLLSSVDGNFGSNSTLIGRLKNQGKIHNVNLEDGVYLTIVSSPDSTGPNVDLIADIAPGAVKTNLKLWIRGDNVYKKAGNRLRTWQDESPYEHIFMQDHLLRRPRVSSSFINYHNAVDFEYNQNQYMSAPINISSGADPRTMIAVVKIESASLLAQGSAHIFHYGNLATNQTYGMTTKTWHNHKFGNHYWSDAAISNHTITDDQVFIGVVRYDGTQDSLYVNSKNVGNKIINLNTGTNTDLKLGSSVDVSGGDQFDGLIAEGIGYNRALSANELKRIQSYLALKYGITLDQSINSNYHSSNNTIIWNSVDNGNHNRNIIGIGRDDSTKLNQKISKSINDDAVLSIATNGDFTSNNSVSSRSNILNNAAFLVISSNSGSAEVNSIEELPLNYFQRMDREWRVSTTNFSQPISLKFNLSFSPSENIKYLLVKDADGDFSTDADSIGELDENGEIEDINFSNGEYFTVMMSFENGEPPSSPGGVNNNLIFWLRASSVEEEAGNAVSHWKDESLYGSDFFQTRAEKKPSISSGLLNFNKIIDFEQNKHQFLHSDVNLGVGANPRTILAVIRVEDVVNSHIPYNHVLHYGARDVKESYGMTLRTAGTNKFGNHYWLATGLSSYAANYKEILLGIVSYDGTTEHLMVNGHEVGDIDIELNTSNTANLKIGSRLDAQGEFFDGDIAEIMGYNKYLSQDELVSIRSYLSIKYGMTLNHNGNAINYVASDSSVIWNASLNEGFSSHIIGIGRDNSSKLHQKISSSINPESILTISTNQDFESANDDPSREEVAGDLSFLLISSNADLVVMNSTVELPEQYSQRMEREWKVSSKNFNQPISLNFDIQYRGIDYFLVGSNTSDFSSGTITTLGKLDMDGNIYDLDLNSINYFTIVADTLIIEEGGGTNLGVDVLPGGISNLNLWVRGDDIYQKPGDHINYWPSYTLDNKSLIQSSSARMPKVSNEMLNFNTMVNFDGAKRNFLHSETSLTLGSNNRTLFSVFKINSTNINNAPLSHVLHYGAPQSMGSYGMTVFTYGESVFGNNYWRSSLQSNYTTRINDILIGSASYVSPTDHLYLNGQLVGQQGLSLITGGGKDSEDIYWNYRGFYLGSSFPSESNGFFDGGISEVISFDKELTPNESSQVETYLAVKYGITLNKPYVASNKLVIWDGFLADASHKSDVVCIGRDDSSSLHQKISASVNNDAVLTISTNLDFESHNSADSRMPIINDYSFLLISSNDGATTVDRPYELPQGYSLRLGREWRVSLTNYTQYVSLKFDISLSSPGDVNYYVMKDSDGDFSDGAILVGELNNNGELENVSFSDGDYFTVVMSTGEEVIPKSPGWVHKNLKLWLKGSGTEVGLGESVSSWQDESAFGHVLSQPHISKRPTIATNLLNYNKVVDFNQYAQQYLKGSVNIASESDTRSFIGVIKVRNVNHNIGYNHVFHY